jgi:hypothetical protein
MFAGLEWFTAFAIRVCRKCVSVRMSISSDIGEVIPGGGEAVSPKRNASSHCIHPVFQSSSAFVFAFHRACVIVSILREL